LKGIIGIEGCLGHKRLGQQGARDLGGINLRAILVEQRVPLAGDFEGFLGRLAWISQDGVAYVESRMIR
jgi:hypothetical protein